MSRGVPKGVLWLGCCLWICCLWMPVGCGDATPKEASKEVSDASETSREPLQDVIPDAVTDANTRDDTTAPEPRDTTAGDKGAPENAVDSPVVDSPTTGDGAGGDGTGGDGAGVDRAEPPPEERKATPEPTPEPLVDGGGPADQALPPDKTTPDMSVNERPSTDTTASDTSTQERTPDTTTSDGISTDGAVADKTPTSRLDDEFVGTSLSSSWQTMNNSLFTYSVSGGALRMVPKAYCVWYHRDRGPYIYKSISGNFTMTTLVRARKASNTSQSVGTTNAPYQFAGLMMRNPTVSGTNENYVFVVVGHHSPTNGLVIEQKTTVNGSSTVATTSWASGDAELRLCRVGSVYGLYARPVGASTWQRMRRYTRSDLPTTLQVGMVSYTFTYRYDLEASFDYIRFQTGLKTEADCTK